MPVDWLAANWPIVIVLMGIAAAWGRVVSQVADLERKHDMQASELQKLREADSLRREKLQAELEAIRIALTEIKAQLEMRMPPR